MTYCVGLFLRDGLVLLSDSRTHAGVDHISTYGKMHVFARAGERCINILTAGNLSVSQAVLQRLRDGIPETEDRASQTLDEVPSVMAAAQLVGSAIRAVYAEHGAAMKEQDVSFDVSMLVGGQVRGSPMGLYQVYAAGNYIAATPETPFLQIGEHKYGKPILDRAMNHDLGLPDGIKLALISMDSTLRSNLSVGLPLDLMVYRRDELDCVRRQRIDEDNAYFQSIRGQWSDALRQALRKMPAPDWPSDQLLN